MGIVKAFKNATKSRKNALDGSIGDDKDLMPRKKFGGKIKNKKKNKPKEND